MRLQKYLLIFTVVCLYWMKQQLMHFWRTKWTLSNGSPAALPDSTPNGPGWRENNATKSPVTSGQTNVGNKASPRWLSWNGCVRVFLHLWEAT